MSMLVDLKLTGRNILIVGGGAVGGRKASKFLQESSNVTVASKDFASKLKKLSQEGKVRLVKVDVHSNADSVGQLLSNADIIVAATNDRRLNERIASRARELKAWVCAVDDPLNSDLCSPATANIGGIQIAIYTGGKSPAMAGILRRKIEKVISQEDVLQVELQGYARGIVKARIPDKELRKKVLHRIVRDKNVKSMLKRGLFEEAKILAKKIIEGC